MIIRDNLFPIYGDDVVRFFILGAIKFCVIFSLTLTRDLKDTIIVTSCGAEAITFLKFYGVLPASFLFFFIYARFSSLVPRAALWYITAAPFFLYFLAFGFVIYPSRVLLHPQSNGNENPLSALYANWTFALYYVVAEYVFIPSV
jgi:AAA family ATP:ADP antiporter